MPYCSNCGTELEGVERFCPECGEEVDANAGRVTRETPERETQSVEMADEPKSEPEQEQNTDSIIDYAIGYPKRNGWGTILIGGVLTLFVWLIVPLVFIVGYFVTLTGRVIRREPTPPRFEDWGELLKLGIMAILVMLPLVIALSIVSFVLEMVSEGLVAIATLAFYYVAPAVFLQFAVTHTFSGAYDVNELQRILTHRIYVVGLLLAVVGAIAGWIVFVLVSLVSFLTIIGWIIIIPMALFYYHAFLYTILGRIYMKIQLEEGQTEGASEPVHSGSRM